MADGKNDNMSAQVINHYLHSEAAFTPL